MSEFDIKANDWDKNSANLERARGIANQLLMTIPFRPGMKVMEFGAGTALLSFMLHDLFSSVTLVDNSGEMIRICNEKILQTKTKHIQALKLDLEQEQFEDKFDMIYTQMALHHVSDVSNMIFRFHHLLNDKGILVIADLYPEDGTFHDEGFTGYKGFDPEWLTTLLNQSGFEKITYDECFIQKKFDSEGKEKKYPVFLMIANKRD
jgi:2-polyprenyl-3-methyl-5-hydroxy-6-metoxy-1,4-benzoquinol methylase